jgi:hypothetical protein
MSTPGKTDQTAQRPTPELLISPIVCPGTPDAHTLTLKIGAQSFRINGHVDFDTREEAAWMADQLLRALANMQQPPMPVTAFNLYTGPQQPDAAYLARWANAPAEATHLSEDSNGLADWWTAEPRLCTEGDGHKTWIGDPYLRPAPTSILGRVACEPRPQAAVDLDRAAYLKRWEGAPEWADFVAEDDDGQATWFDRKPYNHIVVGWIIDEGRAEPAPKGILGSVRCEPRPTPAVDPERAAYLKRWEGAPESAKWRAEWQDGSVFWLDYEPSDIRRGWRCEPRPEVQP